MKEFHFMIDDTRDGLVDLIARNPIVAKSVLENIKGITHLYMDHDLGTYTTENGSILEHDNGYKIMEWAFANELLPPNVTLITSNPSGRIKMEQMLQAVGYERKGNWWIKGD
jgi:hypothetical protein